MAFRKNIALTRYFSRSPNKTTDPGTGSVRDARILGEAHGGDKSGETKEAEGTKLHCQLPLMICWLLLCALAGLSWHRARL